MLDNSRAFSSFSANNTMEVKKFYQDTLGLHVHDVKMGDYTLLELHLTDNMKVVIYPKEDHRPATFTVLNFPVSDLDQTVADLKQSGVIFEQYDNPGIKTDEIGISRSGEHAIAWFKDPAGNILSVIQEK